MRKDKLIEMHDWKFEDNKGLEVRLARTPTYGIEAGGFADDVDLYNIGIDGQQSDANTNFKVINPFPFQIPGETIVCCVCMNSTWVISAEPNASRVFMSASSGIPARTSNTAGKADCIPYFIDDPSGTITELLDANGQTQTIPVYNLSASAVAGSKYITAKTVRGVYVVDMEDCG